MVAPSADNENNKKKIKKSKSRFTEAAELEKRLAAARKRAAADRDSSLTAQNARDEVTHMLLVKALRESFEKSDRLQGGNFIRGSMQRLTASMWKEEAAAGRKGRQSNN
jgi:hypothetical protein